MKHFLRFVCLYVIAACLFSSAQAGEAGYSYLSAQHPPESIWITQDRGRQGDYSLILTDVEYDYEIQDGSKPNEAVMIWEQFYGVRFYIPQDFSKSNTTWTHDECSFAIIGANWRYQDDPIFLIESNCEDNRNAQYHYSVSKGLQLMVFGNTENCERENCPFKINDVYFL